MDESYKTKSVCVIDNGLFMEFAIKLSESFGRVQYFNPWVSGFPTSNATIIGKGVPGIEKIDYLFDHIDENDLFVFPDIYSGDLQLHLESIGKRVFGSRKGDELELFRDESKKLFKELGLPVGKYEVIIGIDALRKFLKSHKDQWVKVSTTRGDMETFHAKDYDLIETVIDDLEHRLGAKKNVIEFIVEEGLNDCVETGTDCYCIDGKYPDKVMMGVEIKDRCYLSRFKDFKALPKELTDYNNAIAPTLEYYRYRNFMSTEIRINKQHEAYMIDECARLGSPPSELFIGMYKNLADIVWKGADGVLVQPELDEKNEVYGAEVMLVSPWAEKNWINLRFPEKIRDNIKLRCFTVINDRYYIVPGASGSHVAAVVATGKSKEDAIESVKEYCSQVEGHDIESCASALDTAQEEIDKLADFGIEL